MGLVLDRIEAEGLAQLSYLVGDDATGLAAVIDPRRDVDVYLNAAYRRGVRIAHVVETHIHADFVSGALELAARTGAVIHGGRSDDYRFDLHQLDACAFAPCTPPATLPSTFACWPLTPSRARSRSRCSPATRCSTSMLADRTCWVTARSSGWPRPCTAPCVRHFGPPG